MKEKHSLTNHTKTAKYTVKQDKSERAARYNYTDMKTTTIIAKNGFATRLAELRESKGISGREMSLSLGQGTGYINNIENAHNLPSLAMFFEICEYLETTPAEFFEYVSMESNPDKELINQIEHLAYDDKLLIASLVKKLKR